MFECQHGENFFFYVSHLFFTHNFFFFCFVVLSHSYSNHTDQIYEDSIQELNNLIGELDSFQKEHELKSQNHSHTNHIDKDFDAFDKISMASSNIGSIGYSIQSNNSNDSKFTFNETDQTKYYNENSSGFESNASEIIHCDNNFNDTESYLKENSEIVVLRRKGSTTDLNGMVDANLPAEPQQRFSSFKSDGSRDELKLSQTNLRQDGESISNIAICDTDNEFKMSVDERLRAKPTVTPRPASLSGLFYFYFFFFNFIISVPRLYTFSCNISKFRCIHKPIHSTNSFENYALDRCLFVAVKLTLKAVERTFQFYEKNLCFYVVD